MDGVFFLIVTLMHSCFSHGLRWNTDAEQLISQPKLLLKSLVPASNEY